MTPPNPVVGISEESAARAYLLSRGVSAMQKQAGHLPLSTESDLPMPLVEYWQRNAWSRDRDAIRFVSRITGYWFDEEIGSFPSGAVDAFAETHELFYQHIYRTMEDKE
jgi:hypothetical protein